MNELRKTEKKQLLALIRDLKCFFAQKQIHEGSALKRCDKNSGIIAKRHPSPSLPSIALLSFYPDSTQEQFLAKLKQAIETHIAPALLISLSNERLLNALLSQPNLNLILIFKQNVKQLVTLSALHEAACHTPIYQSNLPTFLLLEAPMFYDRDAAMKRNLWQLLKNLIASPASASMASKKL